MTLDPPPGIIEAEIVHPPARDLIQSGQAQVPYWLLDARSGDVVWVTYVGPFSGFGGIQWGGAYDGKRLYVSLTKVAETSWPRGR